MSQVDEAFTKFNEFIQEVSTFKNLDFTESDTRSKLLDEMFKNVLGWTENDIERERYIQVGYFDYVFSIPGFQFVVEAKKNAFEFTLPIKHKSLSIGTFENNNKEVVSQIRSYLFEVGLQYGIITNGCQYVISKFANNDGSDWRKNKCIIFNGLDEIGSRFIEFYNLISKFAVVENGKFKINEGEQQKGQILLSSIPNKDKELVRNTLSSSLVPIIDKVFGEIYNYQSLDNKELIEECFIENEEIKKNRSDIEKLFADRPPELAEILGVTNTKNIASQITQEFQNFPINIKTEAAPKPIIVVGSKGAGKTTFINYLFKLSFSEEFLEDRPYIYLDFRKYVDEDLEKINDIVLRDAIDYLFSNYEKYELHSHKVLKRVFFKEIKQNDESIWLYDKQNNLDRYNQKLNMFLEESRNKNEYYFNKLSEYLIRERRLRLCMIIDNADQFDINIQRRAFLFAQSINLKAKCAVIISLREGYYYRWRHQPPFDAFEKSNVYHITAPPYNEVLQKRMDYALQNIELEGKTSGTLGQFNVEVDKNSVKIFLQSIKQNLFGEDNSEILQFLEHSTYPNIREGLEIFKQFLLSGHTEVAQYVLRQQVDPDKTSSIPFWEFIKAVALENKKYYNHEISRIHNIFYPSEGGRSHFIKIKLLKYLYRRGEKLGYTEKFIQTQDVINTFTQAGYKFKLIINELNDLLRFRLIETDDSISDKEFDTDLETLQNICISLKGHYYVNHFISYFVYIDLTLQDTPIFLEDFYNKIRTSFPQANQQGKQNLQGRIETANHFLDYLEAMEIAEGNNSDEIDKDIVLNMKNHGLNQDFTRLKYVANK